MGASRQRAKAISEERTGDNLHSIHHDTGYTESNYRTPWHRPRQVMHSITKKPIQRDDTDTILPSTKFTCVLSFLTSILLFLMQTRTKIGFHVGS